MAVDSSSYPVFTGSFPALVTPMQPNGDIDYDAYKKLIDWHIQEGSDGLVVVGTSGESPTVDVDEHAGLSVVPYYNKPTQEGLFRHFEAIARESDLPIMLYNVPGRTVADLSNDTVLRLAEVQGIIGIKDATADIARLGLLFRDKPDYFQVFSGDDPTAAALMLLGGNGNISVTANIAPALMHELCVAARAGDVPRTRELNMKLAHINKVLFVEANPIPVKWALVQMGLIQAGYRLPMCDLGAQHHETVLTALKDLGLVK